MNASSVTRMASAKTTFLGRRLARHGVYHHCFGCPAARLGVAALLPARGRLQLALHRDCHAPRPVRRLLKAVLAVGGLLVPGHRTLPRDTPQGLAALAAWPRRAAPPPQPRPDRPGPPGAATPPPAGRHRPGPDPLPRPAHARPGRGLPLSAQGRPQPLPRLRHRLRQLPGPALHPGDDLCPARREAPGGPQAAAPPAGGTGDPRADVVGGPGLLERGGDPLPAAGAVSVPDAAGAAPPQAPPPPGSHP